MASLRSTLSSLVFTGALRRQLYGHWRQFSVSSCRRTDGVFRDLTAARVVVPWIEALKKIKLEAEVQPLRGPQVPVNRNISPKRMSDSYYRVILPLARDPWLSDTYLNADGHIRLGTLFMDLDALSGVIAYKHTGDEVTTVTAAFDRITISSPLKEICDLELSGQVTYATGRSSMGISLQVAKAPTEGQKVKEQDILLNCTCTMVSLDPKTKKPVPINPIIVETPEELRLFQLGEQNSKNRKALGRKSLIKHTPNDEESDLIHALWQKQLKWHDPNDPLRKPDHVSFMENTILRTAAIMQPQFRNRHNVMIFGGFLLKSTFELAFCCAASFAHCRPTFVSLDPSTFQNPVPVGSVLYLTATVTYTDPPVVPADAERYNHPHANPHVPSAEQLNGRTRIQVRVDSKVRNVEHGETKPTGQFNYTFMVDKEVGVMPRTYTEFMMYIDARRRTKRVASLMVGMERRAEESMTE